jgi:DNA-binding transcriptional LysR family regulator
MHQLQVFVAVVEHGSLTQAAEHLYLTQPAASVQIRRLRDVVGAPILVREGRRYVPTEVGLTVHRYACEMLATADSLQRDVSAISSGGLDHFTVGATSSHGSFILPYLLARFHHSHPKLRITQIHASSPDLIEQVRRSEIDIGVIHPIQTRRNIEGVRLGVDQMVIVESNSRPLSSDQRLTLEEVSAIPFVHVQKARAEHSGTRLDHLLISRGLPPVREAMAFTSWEGVLEAVRAGVGLGIVYQSVMRGEIQ